MLIKENHAWGQALSFMLVFSSIFGVKVGYLDFSILLPFLILVFCVAIRHALRFNKGFLVVAALIGILLAYQIAIQLQHSEFDINSLLRLARSIIICILFSALIASDIFSSRQVIHAVFYSLLVHAILVDAAAIFDPLNYFLSAISENDRVRPMRASGLLAGFDITGLLCLVGLLMVLLGVVKLKTIWTTVLICAIFILGCFFTSRVSMAFALVFVFVFGASNLLKSRLSATSKFLFALVAAALSFYLVREYVAPIVEVTFSLGALEIDSEQRDQISSRHATQAADSFLWSRMFYLPADYLNTIFGTGVEELYTDVGYVKDIFRYGILGMLFSMFIYLYLFMVGRQGLRRTSNDSLYMLLKVVFLLILILTLKNNYFFTRAVFPLTLLIVCASLMSKNESTAARPRV